MMGAVRCCRILRGMRLRGVGHVRGHKFRVSVYLFDVGMKLLLGNQFLYFPNNRVKMDYANGLVEIKGRKIKMFSTYEEARLQGGSEVSEVKCEVLEVSNEDRNSVVLQAGQDLFLKPHSVTSIQCRDIGYRFEGFYIFLSNFDEGIDLFVPDQLYEDGQSFYVLTMCNLVSGLEDS